MLFQFYVTNFEEPYLIVLKNMFFFFFNANSFHKYINNMIESIHDFMKYLLINFKLTYLSYKFIIYDQFKVFSKAEIDFEPLLSKWYKKKKDNN